MVLARVERAHQPGIRATGGEQQIRFTRGRDGVRLAYAVHGSGPPLIVVSCWLSHLQHDWRSPVWRHFLEELGEIATLVRYDERGLGMSDWNVDDFSFEARFGDLEALVDALGFDQFALLGMSGGSSVAMAYAARHPERVSRLILYGTVCGRPVSFDEIGWAEEETWRSLIRVGWAKEDPVFRRVFTQKFIPGATDEQMQWFDALQRMATSPKNAVESRAERQAVAIQGELPRIKAPTLILQALEDEVATFANAIEVAELIPDARLVPLESRNHILLADEPAWARFVDEVRTFVEPDRRAMRAAGDAGVEALSARELDVLREVAEGRSNGEIGAVLGLSARTVERHLSNAYGKLSVTGKAARAAAVAEVLRRNLV
jgi:pimeloyl-ACP methyl ester carboxylesterase/DNA-binding CsgD family transcriptional regulator